MFFSLFNNSFNFIFHSWKYYDSFMGYLPDEFSYVSLTTSKWWWCETIKQHSVIASLYPRLLHPRQMFTPSDGRGWSCWFSRARLGWKCVTVAKWMFLMWISVIRVVVWYFWTGLTCLALCFNTVFIQQLRCLVSVFR